ncbi:MAG: tRNA threonylcarbamoyladenosine dehydratase [Acidobacteria bacterium]|nr:tRNA threonylcarbamoyladenosine dehydratase [Acidobacteriota bacterium]MCB9397559.1 tRNA threonylcarbamoyladenosine dehydratase [Acidobacteriota bacterium]
MNFDFLPQQEGSEADETYKLHRRFDRMGRLVGDSAMKKLMDAHVMVIGLGGVGSYAAEMLVRSGIGRLTLVDFDEVCITNVNRQLHAMQGSIGKPKVSILAERFQKINPKAEIEALVQFYNQEHAAEILDRQPQYVIDAIDSVTSKAHLLAECIQRGIRVVSSAGAGGRFDPTQIRVTDLAATTWDPLARSIRKILRGQYDFPANQQFGIPCVFSSEPVSMPQELSYDNGQGFRCVCPQGQNEYFTCDNRNLIHGTAGFVTGTFGFVSASLVVRHLVGNYIWPVSGEALPPIAERNQLAAPIG